MKALSLALALTFAAPLAVQAETMTFRIGYSPGGSFDEIARFVAEHIAAHLPGAPDVIVENVPGAGSLKLGKMVMVDTATDGMAVAMVNSSLALLPVLEPEQTDFDPQQVHFLAAMSTESSYCITPKGSGITTFDAFLKSDAKVGATGKASSTYTYAAAIKAAFGASFEIVTGFEGSAEIELAMERGELQGRCGVSAVNLVDPEMLERYTVLAEIGATRSSSGLGGDFILDKVEDPKVKAALALIFSAAKFHHPFIVAPGTTPERVAELRAAFDAMASDPAVLADAEARSILISYTPGVEVEAEIATLLASDPEIQALARQLSQ